MAAMAAILDFRSEQFFFSTFDLQVTPKLSTPVQVNWHFGLGEEVKTRFSRWPLWQPPWISNWKDFTFFYLQVTPMLPTKFHVNWLFGSGEDAKNRFSGHLRFPIGMILAIFDLQVTPMLPTQFRVNWPFG